MTRITTTQFARAAEVTPSAILKAVARRGHYRGVAPVGAEGKTKLFSAADVCALLDLPGDTFENQHPTPAARGWVLQADGSYSHDVFLKAEVAVLTDIATYLQIPVQTFRETEAERHLAMFRRTPADLCTKPESAIALLTLAQHMVEALSASELAAIASEYAIQIAGFLAEDFQNLADTWAGSREAKARGGHRG